MEHKVGTVFSVFTGEARQVAANRRCPNITLDEFITKLKTKLLFEHNISQQKYQIGTLLRLQALNKPPIPDGEPLRPASNMFSHVTKIPGLNTK